MGGAVTGERGSAVLPAGRHTWLGLVAALAALVVVALAGLYADGSRPGALDRRVGPAAEDAGPAWRDVALGVDFLGEPGGAALLVAAASAGALVLRRPRAAVFVVLGPALAVLVTKLLKPLVGRTIHDGSLSFPSGHTAFLTAFALAVALLATGRTGPGEPVGPALVLGAATAAGAAMGWAQVALGAHYPTDALGGWCTALAVTPVTAWLLDRTADRLGRRPVDASSPGRR
ncbi:phosphatase PAP2 family protein [Streptomyces parvulus]|uniref:phosphatase PAP2 family protein n=1 Tax=Streptomyces parvulus TaxID=146923 RepID=UPI003682ABAA